MYRKKWPGGKNTFYVVIGCITVHWTRSTPLVEIDEDRILIMKNSEATFLSPIESIKNIKVSVLEE